MPQQQSTANNQENVDPMVQINQPHNQRVAQQQQQLPASRQRPRSSAATSVTSGTSLGITAVGKGQHKLKSRFSVIRKLGKGTYGKVQLAINKETGQEVAIKTIKKSKIENEQDLERVRREIQIMSSIEHPHIVHIYEVFENKDKIVLVMQYAPGGELYEYVSQSKLLDDNEARRLFRQIATAIYYCHQNKICHRDLKLENILLDEKNNAKLADFGLSNVFDKRRQLSTFCGSPLYASPEIVQGSPYEGPEVDCWSLGVLLYTLVYGAMPFDGSNFKRLVKQISEASYFEPKQKSLASPLIRHLLCADPKRRANIMDICLDSWVNGYIPTSPSISSTNYMGTLSCGQPTSPSEQRHTLLQVAQDMVKLAPVRLDILMELLPPELLAASANNSPPPAQPPTVEPSTTAAHEIEPAPVASYVVRDLEPTESEQQDIQSKPNAVSEIITPDELNRDATMVDVDTNEQQEEVLIEDKAPIATETAIDNQEDVIAEPQVKMKVETMSSNTDQDNSNQMSLEQAPMSLEEPQVINQVAEVEINSIEETKPNNEIEQIEQKMDTLVNEQSAQSNEEPMETTTPTDDLQPDIEMAGSEKPLVATDPDKADDQIVDKDKLVVPNSTNSAGLSADDESATSKSPASTDTTKPKKVKKKIIVVKKVKKAKGSGKDATTDKSKAENEKSETVVEQDDPKGSPAEAPSATQDQKVVEESSKASPDTSLGAVNHDKKEPEVMDAAVVESSASEETPQPSASRKASGVSMRRRSTLVAEMSDKLLQQLAADAASAPTSSNAALKQEAALFGQVNVSEKKVDFERRASLLLTEPEIEHCRRPSFEKQSTIGIEEDMGAQRSDSVETLKEETINNKNKVQDVVATMDEPSPQIPSPTVVSCGWVGPKDDIRSTLEINLSGVGEPIVESKKNSNKLGAPSPSSSSSRASPNMEVLGPVPITRSYKKVTFTKDGARITETGKVYAEKADDGTMRRIERKSKVTHYPVNQGDFGGTKKVVTHHTEETSEEYYSSSGNDQSLFGNDWSSPRSGLERLVMPSSSLLGQPGLDEDDDFFKDTDSTTTKRAGVQHSESGVSSCSSTSTDVFDDIFDNWTGAISMFERKYGLETSQNSLFSRQRNKHHQRHQRQNSTSGSTTGHRCETAKPDYRLQQERISTDMFRPASAFGTRDSTNRLVPGSARTPFSRGLRHSFGGSKPNLFFDPTLEEAGPTVDPFASIFDHITSSTNDEARDLMRQISIKHSHLHSQLSNSQKKLWRGSTPSLFEPSGIPVQAPTSTSHASSRLPPSAAPPRPPLPPTAAHHQHSTSSRSSTISKQQHHQSTVRQISSDGFAVPLDSRPIRRNTANMAGIIEKSTSMTTSNSMGNDNANCNADSNRPTTINHIQRTTSRSSIISDRLSQVHLSQSQSSSSKMKQVANFIELKRTSSNSSTNPTKHININDECLGNQQVSSMRSTSTTTATVATTTKPDEQQNQKIITSSTHIDGGHNDHEDLNLLQGMIDTTNSNKQDGVGAATAAAETDQRIQSWLQESSSNFSSSSGSKSSASFATMEGCGGPQSIRTSFGNLYNQQTIIQPVHAKQQIHHQSNITSQMGFNPLENPIKHHSTSSTTASKIIVNPKDGSGAEMKQHVITSTSSQKVSAKSMADQAAAKSTATTTTTTTTSTLMQFKGGNNEQPVMTTTTTTTSGSLLDDFFANDDPFADHQSSHESTNSSKSILDQLRSRGLRSVLNQRAGNAIATDSGLAMTEQAASSPISSRSSGSAAALLQEMNTSSSMISSAKQHRQHHQQHQTITTSTSRQWSTQQQQQDLTSKQFNEDQEETDSDHHHQLKQTSQEQQQLGQQQLVPDVKQNVDNVSDNATNEGNEQPEIDANKDKNSIVKRDKEQEEDDDDDDLDMKTAKANIKAYRQRMKETDLFLKSLAVADEEAQKQRKELFLFNDLMIRNKLSNLTSGLQRIAPLSSGIDIEMDNKSSAYHSSGYRSAPIQSGGWGLTHETGPLAMMMMSNPTATATNGVNDNVYSDTNGDRYGQQQKGGFASSNLTSYGAINSGSFDLFGNKQGKQFDTFNDHVAATPVGSRIRPRVPYQVDDDDDDYLSLSRASRSHQRPVTPERTQRAQSLAPELSSASNHVDNYRLKSNFLFSAPFATTNDHWTPPEPPLTSRRPLSMSLASEQNGDEGLSMNINSRQHLGKNRRASSVARQTSVGSSFYSDYSPQIPASNNKPSSVYMTEYQRAFGITNSKQQQTPLKSSFHSQRSSKGHQASSQDCEDETTENDRPSVINRQPVVDADKANDDEDDLIEKSMSAYRPSSYVPKVIPSEQPISARRRERISRPYQRRSLTSDLTGGGLGTNYEPTTFIRRTSMNRDNSPLTNHKKIITNGLINDDDVSDHKQQQLIATVDDGDHDSGISSRRRRSENIDHHISKEPVASRRASMFQQNTNQDTGDRLSELESRMEANKRRREELLAASKRDFAGSSGSIGSRLNHSSNATKLLQEDDDDLSSSTTASNAAAEKPTIRARSVARELSPSLSGHLAKQKQVRSTTGNNTTSGSRLLGRSSRLESMEARIKRRSYCVRVDENNPTSINNLGSHSLDQSSMRFESLERSRPASTSNAFKM